MDLQARVNVTSAAPMESTCHALAETIAAMSTHADRHRVTVHLTSRGLDMKDSYIPVSPSRRGGAPIKSAVGAGASEKINGSISLYNAHVLGLRKSRPSNGIPGDSVWLLSRGICLANVSGDTLYC